MRKGLIYSLVDPRDNLVKYVGQTISILNRRYKQLLTKRKRFYFDKKQIEYIELNKSQGVTK